MISPVQITFRNLKPSAAAEARIQAEAAKLNRCYSRITHCRVVVEAPHRHHKRGELFHIRIQLNAPGAEIVIRHEPTLRRVVARDDAAHWSKQFENHVAHKNVYVAIRDAFRSARRRVEDYARHLRGDVKFHDRTPPLRLEKVSPG